MTAEARAPLGMYRAILAVQVADILVGIVVLAVAGRFAVPGQVFGLPVLEFVGVALIAIGVAGLVIFGTLARAARRRWEAGLDDADA